MIGDLSSETLDHRDWKTTEEVDTTRFAVIGLGGYARQFVLPAIDDSDFCEVTAVVSSDPDKSQSVGSEHETEASLTYEQFHDGERSESYDAVYVTTPPARHLEFVESAAGFGKHVLCEKPMEATVERARRIVDVCEESGVALMIAYRLQTEPLMRRLRELVRDEHLGTITQIHAGFSNSILAEGRDPSHWRLDRELAGGGALMDLGIYPLNMSRYFTDLDPESVHGTTHASHEAFDDVEEHVTFRLEFPDGATASCTASFNSFRGNRIQLLGTRGRLRIESAFGISKQREILVETEEVQMEFSPPAVNEVVEQLDYFAHGVSNGSQFEPDGTEGLTDMIVMQAIYESARQEEVVNIGLENLR